MRRWRWWVAERDRWYHTWRDEMSAANRARQGEPIESMTDTELLEHLARAGDHLVKGVILHFRLIPVCDLPVGRLLVACDGLDRPRHRHWREVVHRTGMRRLRSRGRTRQTRAGRRPRHHAHHARLRGDPAHRRCSRDGPRRPHQPRCTGVAGARPASGAGCHRRHHHDPERREGHRRSGRRHRHDHLTRRDSKRSIPTGDAGRLGRAWSASPTNPRRSPSRSTRQKACCQIHEAPAKGRSVPCAMGSRVSWTRTPSSSRGARNRSLASRTSVGRAPAASRDERASTPRRRASAANGWLG